MGRRNADLVDLVARRFRVLDRLDGTALDKAAIAGELDLSRSTVHRALRELEGAGLVTRTDDGYTTSVSGRLAARSYREFTDSLDELCEAGPLLAALPPSAPMSLDAVRGGTVRLAEPPTPYRSVDRVTELITSAAEYRGLSPVVTTPKTVDRIGEAAVDGGLDAEVVCAAPVTRYLRESYPEAVRAAAAAGVDLYEVDDLPFGLAIANDGGDERVAVVVYGPESEPRGSIVNDTAAAVDWAETVFERYRSSATAFRSP